MKSTIENPLVGLFPKIPKTFLDRMAMKVGAAQERKKQHQICNEAFWQVDSDKKELFRLSRTLPDSSNPPEAYKNRMIRIEELRQSLTINGPALEGQEAHLANLRKNEGEIMQALCDELAKIYADLPREKKEMNPNIKVDFQQAIYDVTTFEEAAVILTRVNAAIAIGFIESFLYR